MYSHILRFDSGFAPNPFGGVCTLACCKPVLRRKSKLGDLILGVSSKRRGYRLVYAMEVGEVMTFADYWSDPRFARKRPDWSGTSRVDYCGDNCYEPIHSDQYLQRRSLHSKKDGTEDVSHKKRDLGGKNVLISYRFWYFGQDAIELPQNLAFLRTGRGHRSLFTDSQIIMVKRFLAQLPVGLHAAPRLWREGDTSWSANTALPIRRCR
jgi:hypothetical protein